METRKVIIGWQRDAALQPGERENSLIYGGACRIRTYDHLIKSQMLYQLS